MHIDTGHTFPETIEFRDRLVEEVRADLIVRMVQDSIDRGRATEEKGPNASRNALQIVTLLDALEEFQFSAAIGGARRDEEKARAKRGFFHIGTNSASGIPKTNGRSCGISSTVKCTSANIFASFH